MAPTAVIMSAASMPHTLAAPCSTQLARAQALAKAMRSSNCVKPTTVSRSKVAQTSVEPVTHNDMVAIMKKKGLESRRSKRNTGLRQTLLQQRTWGNLVQRFHQCSSVGRTVLTTRTRSIAKAGKQQQQQPKKQCHRAQSMRRGSEAHKPSPLSQQ
eukprot:m.95008 g.95008  ORF g.95008 m.95008 type:complete len:156 (-) comp13034_c0_seq1:743-1210(-)